MRCVGRPATWLRAGAVALALPVLQGCGGGGGGGGDVPSAPLAFPQDCGSQCALDALTVQDVERVVAQTVLAAQARALNATVAVTDRVGNVLAVYAMNGAAGTFRIDSGRGVVGGLEQVAVLPSASAAISKALTGAYLSSAGNAFTSRSASQIVQQHFNPNEANQVSGPLFGVQFSQLSCSDLVRRDASVAAGDGLLGPKRSPLGLSADPGGLPLYKNGRLVGGIGVIADGVYGLDPDITDIDDNPDETLAVAGSLGFEAPVDIRANRITLDGRSVRFTDAGQTGTVATSIAGLPGALLPVAGYFAGAIRAGVAYGVSASGIRRDTGPFAALGGHVLVDGADNNLYPVRSGTDGGLSAQEAQQILASALALSSRVRAQIRRPLGQPAQVNITVVDSNGVVLGLVRAPDAPMFGIDVALQKARTAAFLSHPLAGAELLALPGAASPLPVPAIGSYVTALRNVLGDANALSNGTAYSTKAIGNLARPYLPEGIVGSPHGPLSRPFAQWSPFATGMQLDLSLNAIVAAAFGDLGVGCTGLSRLRNGMQIFSGGVPIYRVNAGAPQLVGAIGVSGDGTDQDDMIAFLGLAQAGATLGTGIGNAPAALRADALVLPLPVGRLRYVQCPVAPFNDSTAQNVCAGI